VLATAARLGLTGPLEGERPPDGANPGGERVADLEARLHFEAASAMDTPRTATALEWWEDFDITCEGRTHFVSGLGPRGQEGLQWNRRSIALFEKFVREAAPKRRTRGEHVSPAVAASYGAAVRLLRSAEAGYDVAPPDDEIVGVRARKAAKRKQPAPGTRALGSGIRAAHLRAAAAGGFDRTTRRGRRRWAAAVGGHNALLRGGEVGVPDNAISEPRRVLRGRSFEWRRAVRASKGRPWLVWWVVPIKDPHNREPARPTPVARRHDGPVGSDPLCPYDALALAWWDRSGMSGPFPTTPSGLPAPDWWVAAEGLPFRDEPFFVLEDGSVFTTSDVRSLAREIARAAGIDDSTIGAKALRIGGATDGRAHTGDGGKAAVKRRGRWASDIAEIYQRETAELQLELSAGIGGVVVESLEELCVGWVQPAC
jgi:hypothetical protein